MLLAQLYDDDDDDDEKTKMFKSINFLMSLSLKKKISIQYFLGIFHKTILTS